MADSLSESAYISGVVILLPCRSCTRLALASTVTCSAVVAAFIVLCEARGLLAPDSSKWRALGLGARLRCFVEWLPPLIRASIRLPTHVALWVVEPLPSLVDETLVPNSIVMAKGSGKGCRIDHSAYHRNLAPACLKDIRRIIYEETSRHYAKRCL